MKAVIEAARLFASFEIPVRLTGEPGIARSRLARAKHFGSLRFGRPFHALSLAGLPDKLACIELFEAKRGVLRGDGNRIRLAQKADRGTPFLESIEHASPALQRFLWRLINEGSFSPTAGKETPATDIRLIAGSGSNFAPLVAEVRFRPDLYCTFAVAELNLPSLCARRGGVTIQAQTFLEDHSARHDKATEDFTDPLDRIIEEEED
ncbi:MAG: sigma 54-interacting transcriptional regulator [Tabrizicola sp.]|jgi:two-component system response regulator HupR/HoxA|nr:sigma 54-interacting transcriptional regulator [Tabrizicola sp.]